MFKAVTSSFFHLSMEQALIPRCNFAFSSALNKGRIKWTILCHWLVFVLMLLRLSADFCRLAKVSTPMFIAQLHLPPPRVWEVMWLPSIMASMFAQLSLKKNNSSLLKQALLGKYYRVNTIQYYTIYYTIPCYANKIRSV